MFYILFSLVLGVIPANKDFEIPEDGIEIWVVRDAMHTELIVPSQFTNINWLDYLGIDEEEQHLYQYISFGWGERAWYLSGGTVNFRSIPIIFKALYLPSRSVMHVSTHQFEPIRERLISIKVHPEQLQQINQYIFNHFQIEVGSNTFKKIDRRIIGYGIFYEGRGRYHLYHNSNHWTNKILKRTGIRSPIWAPFPHGIMFQLRKAKENN